MFQYTTSIWHHYMYLVERTLRRSVSGVSCLTCNLCPRILFSNSWVPVQRKEMHYSYVILKRKQYFQFFRISSLSLGSKFNTEKCRPSILSHNTDKCDRVFSLTAGDDKIVLVYWLTLNSSESCFLVSALCKFANSDRKSSFLTNCPDLLKNSYRAWYRKTYWSYTENYIHIYTNTQ